VIARELFRPSDALLARIAAGDRGVSDDLRTAVESDSEAKQLISELRSAADPGDISDLDVPGAAQEIPAHLVDLFRRRVATSKHRFSKKPTAGQILSVEQLIGPDGDIGWDVARPLAVLIESPSVNEDGSENAEIWYGWMVAPETDYATHWDFVFTEEDAPFDPLAGMAQIWNPVYVYLKSTSRVLGEISPARLQAVRAMADEYLTADEPDVEDAQPGYVALRTTLDGLPVVTGTPLGGLNDPRWQYQEIYHTAAEAIRVPARLAQDAVVPLPSPSADVFVWLRELFAGFALVLAPVPVGATLGSDEATSSETYRLGDLLEVRGTLRGEGARQLKVRLLADTNIVVIVREEGGGVESYPLSPEQREAIFDLAAGRRYKLDLLDADGRPLEVINAPQSLEAIVVTLARWGPAANDQGYRLAAATEDRASPAATQWKGMGKYGPDEIQIIAEPADATDNAKVAVTVVIESPQRLSGGMSLRLRLLTIEGERGTVDEILKSVGRSSSRLQTRVLFGVPWKEFVEALAKGDGIAVSVSDPQL